MKKWCAAFGFSCMAAIACAQSASIKGVISDTAEKQNLSNAVINLLDKKDSTLINFTRSDKNGFFQFTRLNAGQYLLWVTYPKFADFADEIRTDSTSNTDLGTIALTLKSIVLQEVVVRANRSITMKGDTTEFTADSFHVKEGSTVEELLKNLPGLQVDSKGKITAQGRQVDKVLVDGEEFFGEDPTIATQNIGAKAVDKVQVFDTKSEQDQVKGIGGHGTSKTINIKLKNSAKKGYFGVVEAGTDLNRILNAKAMYNNFKGNKKLSFYATKSNTSIGNLGWDERNKLGVEDNYEYDELTGVSYSFGNNDEEFNEWNLRGIPNAYTAGALYSDKWDEEKKKVNISYLYNRLGTTNTTINISQTLLADTTFFNNSRTKTSGLSQQQVANGKYEWKIDSLTSIKYAVAGSYKEKDLTGNSSSEALNELRDTVNANNRTNTLHAIKKQLDNQLVYKQMFHKTDRLFMTTLRFGLTEDDQNASLNSATRFYRDGLRDSLDITDQLKINAASTSSLGAKIMYSEPITSTISVITEYNFNNNRTSSHRNTFEKDPNGKYTTLNSLFSNNFDLNAFSNNGTVTARYQGKKLKGLVAAGLSAIRLNLDNNDLGKETTYNFTGFTPQGKLSYQFKPQTALGLEYHGRTIQPTLNQLQPLRDNTDPLSIYLGNPDLKVGFDNDITLWYDDYKVLKSRALFFNAGMNFVNNAITNFSVTDSFGKTTNMPINVSGNTNYRFFGLWGSGQGEKKLGNQLYVDVNGGRSQSFLNGSSNTNIYTTVTVTYNARYMKKDKYSLRGGPSASRNLSRSSLRPEAKNNYWTYGGRADGWVNLPWKLELSSDIDVSVQQKTSAFPNPVNITLWNAEISRKFFKKKTFELTFTAHDILNQNIGFTRTINSNFISQQQYDKLSRYFLISAKWSFNKMPDTK